MVSDAVVESAYAIARDRFAALGVDADGALGRLASIPLSLHCWQGDDVAGFEVDRGPLGGGLAATGSYPGRARGADELRADLDLAYRLIPGRHRLNLHALYAESGGRAVPRDELAPGHFRGWIDWAVERGLGLDFNPSFFSHPLAADGWTLAHRDPAIRRFWVGHGVACRAIGAAMGGAVGSPCVTNVWVPDGSKEVPADRRGPRERLAASLDAIFASPIDRALQVDAVEGKLFGLGSESYVAGSHEFYLAYALTRRVVLCLDSGHFHPTESVADKVSSVLMGLDSILLHVSRGVRWDSDHVVALDDHAADLAREVVRGGYLDRVRFGLDYFDASINRVAAWVVGARNVLKAILAALLEPIDRLRAFEEAGDLTARLAWSEAFRTLPVGAVWDRHCLAAGVPLDGEWLGDVRRGERAG